MATNSVEKKRLTHPTKKTTRNQPSTNIQLQRVSYDGGFLLIGIDQLVIVVCVHQSPDGRTLACRYQQFKARWRQNRRFRSFKPFDVWILNPCEELLVVSNVCNNSILYIYIYICLTCIYIYLYKSNGRES